MNVVSVRTPSVNMPISSESKHPTLEKSPRHFSYLPSFPGIVLLLENMTEHNTGGNNEKQTVLYRAFPLVNLFSVKSGKILIHPKTLILYNMCTFTLYKPLCLKGKAFLDHFYLTHSKTSHNKDTAKLNGYRHT